MKKPRIIISVISLIFITLIGIVVAVALNQRDSVVPEDSEASYNDAPKFIAASLCSGFTSTDPVELARRDRELVNVDGIHCRFEWNRIHLGAGQYDFNELGNWIRLNHEHGKKSVIGIMTRSDYKDDCNVAYQSAPKFLLNNSTYDPVPGNRYTASWGDDSGEGSCERGTPFSWDIPYKQVNYLNSNVKSEMSGMINAFANYLRTTPITSGSNLKLIDAMGGVEIAVGHQGEPRPIWTNRGAKSTPSQGVPSGQWQTCPTSGYNPNTPNIYSDWCHFVWKWGNGNQYSAANNWVSWQSWLVDTYHNAFGSSMPMYIDSTGALAGNGENAPALQHAASLGIGAKSTGISPNQGPGSGVEYRDGELNYGNWWNVLRKHWDDALKPPMVVEHGTSVIPVFNSIGNQKHPNLFYWMVLAGLSYHVDQFHLLSSMIQPSFDPNTGFVTGLNDEFLTWAKPYTGADRENSPGAFTVLRENALMEGKVTDWFSNSETRTKWQSGTDTGCYYCDRGFGPSVDGTTFNTSTAYGGNYDFFMSSDNGRGEQNIPLWNYNGNYSPVNGAPDPAFPKEGMFYRRTDRATNRNEFCFDVEDRFRSIRGGSGNYTVVIKYKNDSVVFELAHKNGVLPQVSGTGDGKWKSVTLNLTNATFNNDFVSAGGRSYDFCVRRVSGSDLALHMVEVKPEGSGTTPPASVSNPTFNPSGGTYTSAQTVTISTTTSGATIRYTLDGSTPSTTTGTIYSAPVTISSTTTLKAIAYKSGSNPSSVSSATYTINTGTTVVSSPIFTTIPGTTSTFTGTLSISLSTATSGATIRYTTNGTTPSTTNGTVYSAPLTLTSTTTVKAIAYKSGMTPSSVVSKTYTQSGGTTQVSNPSINPSTTTFTSSVSVSISSTTSGATIRYTTNGTTPSTTNGTIYSAPFILTSTATIKAIAYKSGMTNSGVVSRTYTKSTGGTSYCVPHNLNSAFDNRDGVSNTLNRVKLKPTEIPGGKLLVGHRETVADFVPNNTSNVSKCWGKILDASNNSVACTSGQVFCAWSSGRAYLRGQDPTFPAGGCSLMPDKTYKTEVFLQNSASQTLQSCQSAVFNVTRN